MNGTTSESEEYELATFKLKGARLQSFVKVVGAIADECKILVTEKGWTTNQVSPDHVEMIEASIPKKQFEEWDSPFEHTSLDSFDFGLDLDKMKDYLKRSKFHEPKKGESYAVSMLEIVIMANDGIVSRLILNAYNGQTTIKPVDTTGMSEPKVPNLKLSSKTTLGIEELGRFKAFMKNAAGISDHVTLSNEPGDHELTASAEGDTDKANVKLENERGLLRDGARSVFELARLDNIFSAMPVSEIGIELGNDYPMILTCPGIEATYLLAPRIEDS